MNFHSYYFFMFLCIVIPVSASNISNLETQKVIKNDALEINSVVASKAQPLVPHVLPNNKLESPSKPLCHWMNIFRVQLPYAARPVPTVNKPMHHIIKRNKRSLDLPVPIAPEQYRVAISRSMGPALLSTPYQTEKYTNQKRESGPQITLLCRPVGNKNFGAHTITRRATLHISVDPNSTEDALQPYEQINLTNFTVYLEDPEPITYNYQTNIPASTDEQNLYQKMQEINPEPPKQKYVEDKLPVENIPQNNLQFGNTFSNVSRQPTLLNAMSKVVENSRLNVPRKQFREEHDLLQTNPMESSSTKKLNNVSSKVLKGYIKMKPTPNTDDYKPISFRWQMPVNERYEQPQPSIPDPPSPALDAPFDEYQQVLDSLPPPLANSKSNPTPDNKVQVWGYSNHFLFPANSRSDGKQNKPLDSKLEAEMKIDKSNKKRVVDEGAIVHRSSHEEVGSRDTNQTFKAAEIRPGENKIATPKCTANCHPESEIDKNDFEMENQSEWLRNIQKQYYPYWPFYYVVPKANSDYEDAVTTGDKQNR